MSRLHNYLGLAFYLTLLTAIGCTVFGGNGFVERVGDTLRGWFGEPTPREAWLQEAKQDGRYTEATLDVWEADYSEASDEAPAVDLPHRTVYYHGRDRSALAIDLELPPGRLLSIEALEPSQPLLFADLTTRGRPERVLGSWDTLNHRLTYENRGSRPQPATLILQVPPSRPTRYELRLTTGPTLVFPVAGYDETAIQSFWGANRDGGRRRHEGNDIFAPRGTPLVAVANGRVSRTGNGGLGGKTVWLRDGEGRGVSYYYAHLNEQRVRGGDYVERGDTLGTVGNTGNARTTPPHLHFGVYAGGAFDPYPLLRGPDPLPGRPELPLPEAEWRTAVPKRGNHYLRERPERGGKVLRQLENGEAVTVLGVSGRFYRIVDRFGVAGYANFD